MTILKKRLIWGYMLFFLVISISYSGTTSGESNRIKVVYTDWFPYTYGENGEARGFEIEVFRAVMKKMGIEAQFVNYPWRRCLNGIEEGYADALISLLKTPEREEYTLFPDTCISLSKTMFFTKIESNIQFKGSYADLKDYIIGVIAGFAYGEAFDKADYLKKDVAQNSRMLITKLLNDRHDLAAENQAVISGYAEKMGVRDKIKFLEPPIHTQKLYVGFSKIKKLEKLCDDFSKALLEFKSSGEYGKILKKYGVNPLEMIDKKDQ